MTMIKNAVYTLCCFAGVTLITSCNLTLFDGLAPGPSHSEKRLERALDENDDNPHAQLLKGRNALTNDRPEDALKAFNRAIKIKPDFEEAWEGKGLALMEAERFRDANKSFADMAARFPQSSAAWEGLAITGLSAGLLEQAEDSAQETLTIDEKSAVAYRVLGEVAYIRTDYTDALQYWQKAMEFSPAQKKELQPIVNDLRSYLMKYGNQ